MSPTGQLFFLDLFGRYPFIAAAAEEMLHRLREYASAEISEIDGEFACSSVYFITSVYFTSFTTG